MKTTTFLAAAAIMALTALAACSKSKIVQPDPKPLPSPTTDTPVRFTAGIEQIAALTTTRAAGTAWAADDKIGVFMVQSGTAVETNRPYTTTAGDGAFAAAAGEMYHRMDGSAADFVAYHPFRDGATMGTPINVQILTPQTAANQPTFDLLWSNNAKGYSKTSTGAVALTFKYMLPRIVMNCKADASVGAPLNGSMAVKINGMNTAATFDLAKGTFGAPSKPDVIVPRIASDGSSCEAIILPGSYKAGAVTVEFYVGSERFVWNMGASAFEGGNTYTYAVTLTRTGVTVAGTITPRITNDRGAVTAE